MRSSPPSSAPLILLIQIPLLVRQGGWFAPWQLEETVSKEKEKNTQLEARNGALPRR